MSYNGIGLVTPKGSSTSGYVQRNLGALKKTTGIFKKPQTPFLELKPLTVKKANKKILEHKRKRNIEILCINLREKLEEEKKSPEEIDKAVTKLRLKYQNASLDECEKGMEETHSQLLAQNERNERLKKALQISSEHRTGDAFRFEEMRRQKDEKAKTLTAEQILWKAKHPYLSHETARHEVLDKTRERYDKLEGRDRRRKTRSKSPKDDYEALQREMDRSRREERENREREERIRKFNARGENKSRSRRHSPVSDSSAEKPKDRNDKRHRERERERHRHREHSKEKEKSRNKETSRYERPKKLPQRREEKQRVKDGRNGDESKEDQRKKLKERRLREAEEAKRIRSRNSPDTSEPSEEGAIKEPKVKSKNERRKTIVSEKAEEEKNKEDHGTKRDERGRVTKTKSPEKAERTERTERIVVEKPKKVIDRSERWAGGSRSQKHKTARY